MEGEKEINRGKRGYYIKQLAALNNTNHQFPRGRKGIKKDNKNVCKKSRETKKLYIQSLENKNQSLKQEINSLQQEVAILKQQLEQKKTNPQQTHADTSVKDLLVEYSELVKAVTAKDEVRIKRSLAVLRSRFGIAGRDRIKWMEEHLLRVVELAIPMHFRLLLQNCDNSKAFFELLGGGQEMSAQRANFSQGQKQILKQMKPKIKKAKQVYSRIFQKLHETWGELKKYGHESQKIIDQIEDKVNHPIFIGHLLMTLDNHRNKNATIKQAYPLNYFKQLSQEGIYFDEDLNRSPVYNEEDILAFDMFFSQRNDFN